MLNVVCVKWGDRYPNAYVHRLRDAVARSIKQPHRFICFTDNARDLECETRQLPIGLEGWWNKVALFSPGAQLQGRTLYLDLDVVITGSLDELVNREGSWIIKDWWQPCFNSSVMLWDGGTKQHLWHELTHADVVRLHGDQDWITERGGDWQTFPSELCVSYKANNCQAGIPDGAIIVVFHGRPKPHEVNHEWVERLWGRNLFEIGRDVHFQAKVNTSFDVMHAQIEHNLKRQDVNVVVSCAPHKGRALICGGGPSLLDTLPQLRRHMLHGGVVFALNGVHDWLLERGITPHFHVMLDARQENVQFVQRPRETVCYMIASQCHPDVFDALKGYSVWQWVKWTPTVEQLPCLQSRMPLSVIGSGATVGLSTMALAHTLGFRHQRLFGFDSSYRESAHHAYPQPMNDKQNTTDIIADGRRFHCGSWMAKQAMEFQALVPHFIKDGATIKVHGTGLLPWIAQHMGLHATLPTIEEAANAT